MSVFSNLLAGFTEERNKTNKQANDNKQKQKNNKTWNLFSHNSLNATEFHSVNGVCIIAV